ncbi:MAG: hydantoinase/oxoprolinase family protein [Spirochaetes bacterium]|jgi:N-methylhydantoinase A/oxoprolinase/acetone carboxylase beta subunit|nr:hydantoinase/oxoprolinase family protein [Spirochaetota bacterium]
MYLGVDVGGTHTDAVLLDEKGVISSYKAVTDRGNLLSSMSAAIEEVTKNVKRSEIGNINLSTTLSTNAIVENKLEEVGIIVSSGPGIHPKNYSIGSHFNIIPGSIDHRGKIIAGLDEKLLRDAVSGSVQKKLRVFAAVTKFSTRNPGQENEIGDSLSGIADFITLGHRMSPRLSFPRRIATSYYNSAVWRIYRDFADSIEKSLKGLGIGARINILKADGGTMPIALSRTIPVESILSGPAASILGIISLCDISEDSIILDIGGTTTDIAIFASGSPLIERDGIAFAGLPTHVRALKNSSIGIGGDSLITAADGKITVGPERRGPAMAVGGDRPALVDAMNITGSSAYGNVERSRAGIEKIAEAAGLTAEGAAAAAEEYAVGRIREEAGQMLRRINEKPVYTIHEMIEGIEIKPARIFVMGGPAEAFRDRLAAAFGIPVTVPENYGVANAIGAALAKTTFDIELFADTSSGVLIVPNLGIKKQAPGDYTVEKAEEDARNYLAGHVRSLGGEDSGVEVVESTSFRMVQGFSSAGRDIRVKCQIKPGVVMKMHGGVK